MAAAFFAPSNPMIAPGIAAAVRGAIHNLRIIGLGYRMSAAPHHLTDFSARRRALQALAGMGVLATLPPASWAADSGLWPQDSYFFNLF